MNYYRELHEALDAMPEKKLITGHFYYAGCFCAVGALREARCKRLEWLTQADDSNVETTDENDNFDGTEEGRHAHMLAYAARKMV